MTWVNVASILECSEVEGPGRRFVLWAQGCLKRCKDCCNPHFLALKQAHLMQTSAILEQIILSHKQHHLEGVTFLGGEPFLQAQGLGKLAKECQKLHLSVMVFSGYKLEELKEEKFKGASLLLKHTDVLVDGEFDNTKTETKRNYVGSSNQVFHYLSNRYNKSIETMPVDSSNEWRIDLEGHVRANGLPFVIE
ncbi:4Fe-4S single cluster domain-containing protein [Helicobacter cetorum]|uniref:Anaerobic ribonucleoside-triphosphate reductase-activating protein n=1 Tax=Helicobacter cetorum (strain ATCC BAA-429 / MIT 00-7128) TaxID=182217 RepID=I0ELV2_HELC0|nr:4Fe-4S single cluster domain-containing protein [Helicobacter cetorum]AFI03921.1 radical SAM domain-containing protein [Helicobacter cetorum MIT 00-7128]